MLADTLRASGVFLGVLLALLTLRYVTLKRLRAMAASTATRVDDLVVLALQTPSLFWCLAVALEAALRSSPLDPSLQQVFSVAITLLLVVSATMVAAHIAGGVVTLGLARSAPDGKVPGLGQAVAKGLVTLLGGMVVLNVLGVEIAPLLTALGVGGLAVALALQDTLSNFFAGIHILLERPYTIGNYIRLENGAEGWVIDIGWRTTRVRTRDDDVVVVPNSKMAGSTIVNFHLPIRRSRVIVKVGVAYASDAEHVRAVLLDEAERVRQSVDCILADPAPDVVMVAFGESSLDFELRVHLTDIARQPFAVDVLHRAVLKRFRAEGIGIPFPMRHVLLDRIDRGP
jgi:small-conductance mechanosensitive channel